MSKTKTKSQPVYKASDDSEHATAAEAEARDVLIQASSELNRLANRVCDLLAANGRTADGETLNMRSSQTYWYLHPNYFGGLPRVEEVWFWPFYARVELDRDGGNLTVTQNGTDHMGKERKYKVSELYADKRKAIAAQIAMSEERMVQFQSEIDQMRKAGE